MEVWREEVTEGDPSVVVVTYICRTRERVVAGPPVEG